MTRTMLDKINMAESEQDYWRIENAEAHRAKFKKICTYLYGTNCAGEKDICENDYNNYTTCQVYCSKELDKNKDLLK